MQIATTLGAVHTHTHTHTGIFRKWKEIIRDYKNIEKDIGRLYLVEGQHNYQA